MDRVLLNKFYLFESKAIISKSIFIEIDDKNSLKFLTLSNFERRCLYGAKDAHQ